LSVKVRSHPRENRKKATRLINNKPRQLLFAALNQFE